MLKSSKWCYIHTYEHVCKYYIYLLYSYTRVTLIYFSIFLPFLFFSPRNHTIAIDLSRKLQMSFITLCNRLRTRERLETSSCRMDTFSLKTGWDRLTNRPTSIDSYCINSGDIHTQTHVYTRGARSCANFPVIRPPADRYNRIVSAKKTFVAGLLIEFFFFLFFFFLLQFHIILNLFLSCEILTLIFSKLSIFISV